MDVTPTEARSAAREPAARIVGDRNARPGCGSEVLAELDAPLAREGAS
ncbi:hypothetical protein [Streptomyces sp. NPDC020141]